MKKFNWNDEVIYKGKKYRIVEIGLHKFEYQLYGEDGTTFWITSKEIQEAELEK